MRKVLNYWTTGCPQKTLKLNDFFGNSKKSSTDRHRPEPLRSWIGEKTFFGKFAASSEKEGPDVGVDFPLTLLEPDTEDERENHDVLLNKDIEH